ncbi:MAG TPA: ABC transporter ATP-binding protein [Candidatus Limnocylindria bacterium]|nr:ABC transporter ATP-binding protein [Candidatus Limnocylindria bacterium]
MTETPPVLEMRGITKRFATGTLANDAIDLDLRAREIHALLGENGAGKSTLMNILYGLVTPDEGEVLIDGSSVAIRDPADAIARGIGMVHQHFMLVPVLTVAENVVLGQEIVRRGGQLLDMPAAERRIRELADRLGFTIDPSARVDQLSLGQQQRVEILKAIYRGARILVLDEPTAVLTPQETREIFGVLRRLREEGTSIIFISHKLDEVLEIADRITVIRRGKVVGSRTPVETNENELAELMVGRAVSLRVDRGQSHPGDVVLEATGLRAADDRRHEVLKGVDLTVRAGEIVGVAGVGGNGQDELVECIVGLRRPIAGTINLAGRDITKLSVEARRDRGVAYVPADRQRFGLVLPYRLPDNFVLTRYGELPYAGGLGGFVRQDRPIRAEAGRLATEFDVRSSSLDATAATLSGGNQQKVVVAREFRHDLKVLVLDQPTRGIDVGSIEFIHKQVIERRDAGVAVLLVSAELDEVLDLSDRILVIYRGRIVASFSAADAQRERVGLLMATGEARP